MGHIKNNLKIVVQIPALQTSMHRHDLVVYEGKQRIPVANYVFSIF